MQETSENYFRKRKFEKIHWAMFCRKVSHIFQKTIYAKFPAALLKMDCSLEFTKTGFMII